MGRLTIAQRQRDLDMVTTGLIEAQQWLADRVVEFEQRRNHRPRPRRGWMRFVAATSDIVEGQRLDMVGADLRAISRNGPVLWKHNQDELPVGRTTMFVDGDLLVADVQWGRSRRAREIARAYRRGELNAVSLGWDQLDFRIRQDGTFHVTWWRPTELSAVTVPANPRAVRVR